MKKQMKAQMKEKHPLFEQNFTPYYHDIIVWEAKATEKQLENLSETIIRAVKPYKEELKAFLEDFGVEGVVTKQLEAKGEEYCGYYFTCQIELDSIYIGVNSMWDGMEDEYNKDYYSVWSIEEGDTIELDLALEDILN